MGIKLLNLDNLSAFDKYLLCKYAQEIDLSYDAIVNVCLEKRPNLQPSLENLVLDISKTYEECRLLLEQNDLAIPDLTLLTGPGHFDGHAIPFEGKGYSFLDLSLISSHYQNKAFDKKSHLIHELIHGIHYSYSPQFSLFNTKENTFRLLNRAIAEGVATFFTGQIMPDADRYWFGFIPDELKARWESVCRHRFKDDLNLLVNSNFSESLEQQFFSLIDFDEDSITHGRRAYFFGEVLTSKAAKKFDRLTILRMNSIEWLDFIKSESISI